MATGLAGAAVGAAAAAHAVPSVVSLGQWSSVRALPQHLCTWRGPRVAKVALTFDDGPSPGHSEQVLDRLDELGMPATFFCLGSNVERSPALVAEIAARGHVVGVHGYHHEHHLLRSPQWVARDLQRAVAVIGAIHPRPLRWFRPPYGQSSGPTMWTAHRMGLRMVLWSAWDREWAASGADEVVDRVDGALAPGAIVLLHDCEDTSPPGSVRRVLDALPRLAERLASRGLTPVTLDDLLAS